MFPCDHRIVCVRVSRDRGIAVEPHPQSGHLFAVELVVLGIGHHLQYVRLGVPLAVAVAAHPVVGQKLFRPGFVAGQVGQAARNDPRKVIADRYFRSTATDLNIASTESHGIIICSLGSGPIVPGLEKCRAKVFCGS